MSSANRDILTLCIYIPFTSSFSLIAQARNSKTMLNWSGENGHDCLIPEFRGNGFRLSPLSMMLAIILLYIPFVMLRYILQHYKEKLYFLRAFIMKLC
jgi:hypothetical protein